MDYEKRHHLQPLITRSEENQPKTVEGYFILFNQETELFPSYYEEIAPESLECLSEDIRALVNHNPNRVLGRTKAGTLSVKVDEKGLYGVIAINEKDSEAVNLYERVKRGDVDQCSFGFNILDQEKISDGQGEIRVRITKIELFEVSIVTFPAYEATEVLARSQNSNGCHLSIEQKRQKIKETLKRCY